MRRHNKYSVNAMRLVSCKVMLSALFVAGWSTAVHANNWLEGKVATIQALDKITARISTLTAPVGVPRKFGTLEVTVQRCVFHPPEETPENGAFVVIRDLGYDKSEQPTDVFSGWMFSSSPAISALEHPVYDITILVCSVS